MSDGIPELVSHSNTPDALDVRISAIAGMLELVLGAVNCKVEHASKV